MCGDVVSFFLRRWFQQINVHTPAITILRALQMATEWWSFLPPVGLGVYGLEGNYSRPMMHPAACLRCVTGPHPVVAIFFNDDLQ